MPRGITDDYTTGDELAIAALAPFGARFVALVLGRSVNAVKLKAGRMEPKVSLRRKSQISDTVLTPAQVEAIKHRRPGIVCSRCGYRLASPKLDGVCGVCHKEDLIAVHLKNLAEVRAEREQKAAEDRKQRELWRVRQQLKRERDRLAKESGGDAASV